MSRFFDIVSKPVRDRGGALPPLGAGNGRRRIVTLDSNENPLGPSPRAIQAMQTALTSANSYPDDDCSTLRSRLADSHGLTREQVLVTAGSTGLLSLLCQTLLAPGLNAVTSERSFIVYAMAVHSVGAQLIEAPMLDDGIDLDAVLNAINEYTRIVFLANPNNPTGTMLDAAAIDKFLGEVPGHVLVVLDEAYFEFASHFAAERKAEYSRSVDCLKQNANVVVLRTFSKVHGLAGLRIGYGAGPAELIASCARLRNTFSVSSVAQAAALAAMDDPKHIQRTVANNATQAQVLGVALSEMDFKVVPTWGNFLYCDAGEDAAAVADRLREGGVRVRPLSAWGAPTCLRVSIGTPDQNQLFLNAMRKITTPNPTPR